MKQNIMIIVILIAVTFSGAFGVIMFYNTVIDTKAFAEIPGMEICNVIAVLNPAEDQTDAVASIENMDHVDKVMYFDEIQLKVEDTEVAAYITEDYSKKRQDQYMRVDILRTKKRLPLQEFLQND